MKKQYNKPSLQVVKLQLHHHILQMSAAQVSKTSNSEGINWSNEGIDDDY